MKSESTPSSELASIYPPDAHHLRSAIGWMQLGNYPEAGRDLTLINGNLDTHPVVIQARCMVALVGEEWDDLHRWAGSLVSVCPGKSHGWLYHARALEQLGRSEEALKMLRNSATQFSEDPLLAEALANLLSRNGDLAEAEEWRSEAAARQLTNGLSSVLTGALKAKQ